MSKPQADIYLIASQDTWIVDEARQQLAAVARLPGVQRVVGMPDLHPGKGCPVGAAVISRGVFYPHLAGNDLGCGMLLWQTGLPRRKVKLDRWAKKLTGLDEPADVDIAAATRGAPFPHTEFDGGLGTIGGGNHFAELLAVDAVHDPEAIQAVGLDPEYLVLLVHSGSRGLGESVASRHRERSETGALAADSPEAAEYLAGHDHAVAWARLNRRLIALRVADRLGTTGRPLVDLCHNSITRIETGAEPDFLHRKGAAPADQGVVVLPGSRGTLSHLVWPTGDQAGNAWSVAHGAGRKWSRTEAHRRLKDRYRADSLTRTTLQSRVICEDRPLLYEEAPEAYKDINTVIRDLEQANIALDVAVLKPLITYKTRRRESA